MENLDIVINKINCLIQDFLDEYDFDIEVMFGDDFYAYPISSAIEWSMLVTEEHDKDFVQNAINQGLLYNVDPFILSVFHEVGHVQTYETLSWFQKMKSKTQKFLLQSVGMKIFTKKCVYIKYYNLFDEAVATQWAIDFINENYSKIFKLWGDIYTELKSLYVNLNS